MAMGIFRCAAAVCGEGGTALRENMMVSIDGELHRGPTDVH